MWSHTPACTNFIEVHCSSLADILLSSEFLEIFQVFRELTVWVIQWLSVPIFTVLSGGQRIRVIGLRFCCQTRMRTVWIVQKKKSSLWCVTTVFRHCLIAFLPAMEANSIYGLACAKPKRYAFVRVKAHRSLVERHEPKDKISELVTKCPRCMSRSDKTIDLRWNNGKGPNFYWEVSSLRCFANAQARCVLWKSSRHSSSPAFQWGRPSGSFTSLGNIITELQNFFYFFIRRVKESVVPSVFVITEAQRRVLLARGAANHNACLPRGRRCQLFFVGSIHVT